MDKGLKGKAEIPTLMIKGFNGEKWSVPIPSGTDLDNDYSISEEVRISFEAIPIRSLDESIPASNQPVPDVIEANETTASVASCPKGALADEMGVAEVCVECEHLTRVGDEELGQGIDSCDLLVKPVEQATEEKNRTKEML